MIRVMPFLYRSSVCTNFCYPLVSLAIRCVVYASGFSN